MAFRSNLVPAQPTEGVPAHATNGTRYSGRRGPEPAFRSAPRADNRLSAERSYCSGASRRRELCLSALSGIFDQENRQVFGDRFTRA